MSFGSLVQLGFNSAAGPKSVLGGVTSVWGNHWNGGIKLDETNVGFKFQGFPLSLGLVSYKETPKVQAGGCSLSEPRLASSQEHLRWLHVCKCLASMELLGLVWGGDSLTKIDAHTHVFFSHSNNFLVGWFVFQGLYYPPRIRNGPMNQPTFRIYKILQDTMRIYVALRWGGSVGRWDIEREFLFHKHVIGHGISSTTRLGRGDGQCWFMMYWMKPLVSFDPQIQSPEFSHGL